MKYRKNVILTFVLLIFFTAYWYMCNNGEAGADNRIVSYDELDRFISSAYGYCSFIRHMSLLLFVYLASLFYIIPMYGTQELIRKKRKKCYMQRYGLLTGTTLQYAIIYTGINIIMVSIYSDKGFIMETSFYMVSLLAVIIYFLFYTVFGTVFLVIMGGMMNRVPALIITEIAGLLIYGLEVVRGYYIWTPEDTLNVYEGVYGVDQLIMQKNIANSVALCIVLLLLGYFLFRKKDIMIHEKI